MGTRVLCNMKEIPECPSSSARLDSGRWVTRSLVFALLACFLSTTESRSNQRVTGEQDLVALWPKFANSNYVVSGTQHKPKSVIYAIFDPNCSYCHYLWLALRPYEAAGLQVRWVPVGFLNEDSLIKAAAVIDGGDRVLTQLQESFEEGFRMQGRVSAGLKSKLDENRELMHTAHVHGTPGIFYRDRSGHVMKCSGMPKLRALPEITGLAPQPETDPRLNRFR